MAKRSAQKGKSIIPVAVDAVVFLRPIVGEAIPLPENTRRIAEGVLKQAEVQSGIAPEQANILDQLHSFAVRAQPEYIQALSGLEQVERVITDDNSGLVPISPVKKRGVRLPD